MKILLIEDDLQVCEFVANGFASAGHTFDYVTDGQKGLSVAREGGYDVVILDRMLPGIDGLNILHTLRSQHYSVPVIILSALGDVDDRVIGLKSGGDDYLVKPFSFAELIARVEVLGRRAQTNSQIKQSKLQAGDIEVDLISREVKRAGKVIDLQAREFKLLEYMLRNKNQLVTRTMLLENVWDYHFDPQTNIIDVHISRLRNKIDKEFNVQMIRTVRGAGYIIQDE